jgi:hypothetical protein
MDFAQEINSLKDTMVVMAEIQRRQAAVQKMQVEDLVRQAESLRLHEGRMNHIDMRLAEITDKLDGLIGFMDNQFRRPPQ